MLKHEDALFVLRPCRVRVGRSLSAILLASSRYCRTFRVDLAERGICRPAIARRYPFEQYAAAMAEAFAGKAAGRIVLTMP